MAWCWIEFPAVGFSAWLPAWNLSFEDGFPAEGINACMAGYSRHLCRSLICLGAIQNRRVAQDRFDLVRNDWVKWF